VPISKRDSTITLLAPRTVVDETSIVLRVRWTTAEGQPVSGDVVVKKRRKKRWPEFVRVSTGADGWGQVRVTPRDDSAWRAHALGLDWVTGTVSAVRRVDNLPPVAPVAMPPGAPRPRITLPPQPRATGEGARVRIGAIGDGVWRQMVGASWHPGCPGRSALRVVRVNYWGYDGYRHRGEIVAAASAAHAMGAALAEMYRRELPIRAMYRVDRFGWNGVVRGGNDYRSMAAGNTSAFNCRDVVGRPGVRSPHASGRALDLNTWENPYRSARGLVPNAWWQGHSHPQVAWRSHSHPVIRLMARHGLRWTYGLGDTQHFDYVGGHGRSSLAAEPVCRRFCD
jgi:hypothetical protein